MITGSLSNIDFMISHVSYQYRLLCVCSYIVFLNSGFSSEWLSMLVFIFQVMLIWTNIYLMIFTDISFTGLNTLMKACRYGTLFDKLSYSSENNRLRATVHRKHKFHVVVFVSCIVIMVYVESQRIWILHRVHFISYMPASENAVNNSR